MMHGRRRLLVVEDDVFLREILSSEIELGFGLEVLQANGGRAAMALLSRTRVDLVLTDLNMPEGNGLELLEWIKRRPGQPTPVVIMTGFSGESYHAMQASGAAGLLCKPFEWQVLAELLERLIPRREPSQLSVANESTLLPLCG